MCSNAHVDDGLPQPRRGELLVFDKLARGLVDHIVLPVPTARTFTAVTSHEAAHPRMQKRLTTFPHVSTPPRSAHPDNQAQKKNPSQRY